jgi:hypothetical protein
MTAQNVPSRTVGLFYAGSSCRLLLQGCHPFFFLLFFLSSAPSTGHIFTIRN